MSWPAWNAAPPATAPLGAVPGSAPGIQYTPEQWAQMQQQNWQQWAQWQQQYQQWHQQYGAEYQKSMNALSQNPSAVGVAPVNTNAPPPLPAESKPPPPPPPDDNQYTTAPPKLGGGYSTVSATPIQSQFNTQYNVPPPHHSSRNVGGSQQFQNAPPSNQFRNQKQFTNKRPFGQQGGEYDGGKRQMLDTHGQWSNNQSKGPPPQQQQTPAVASKVLNLEELTEAEKKFDKEFAAWEAQFNKWKDQNANHPDKTQYMEYEKKWESWRNSLLERREQMRKKRLALLANMKATGSVDEVPKGGIRQPLLPSPSIKQPLDSIFTKPPPNQNNEPLSFKPVKRFPGEELPQNDDSTGFLKASSTDGGGIPGLDLVKGGSDIEEHEEIIHDNKSQDSLVSKGPDLDAISKGINSILGDPKLMNMLSMVSQNQNPSTSVVTNTTPKITEHPPSVTTNPNPVIPRLLDMAPIVPPVFDQSNQGYDDVRDHQGQREAVTNFDDQTRMSFTNGPNEDGGYGNNGNNFNNRGPGGRYSNRFGANNFSDAKNQFGGRFGNGLNRNNFDNSDNRNNFNKMGNNFNQGGGFNRGGAYNKGGDDFGRNRGGDYNRTDNYKFNNFQNDSYGDYDDHNNDYNQWNEEEDYNKFHERFNDGDQDENALPSQPPHRQPPPLMQTNQPPPLMQVGPPIMPEQVIEPIPPLEEEERELFVPEMVIDYEHKSLKPLEPEVVLEPIYMFDYRHKPVSRIPYPQRPRWLYDAVKNIRQFDPLAGGRFGFERTPIEKPLVAFERSANFDRPRSLEKTPFESDTYERRPLRFDSPRSVADRFGSRKSYDRDRSIGRSTSIDRNRYENKYSTREDKETKNLEFEDLSDDDFDDDQKPKDGGGLKFSPPQRTDRSPDRSHSTNPVNPEHGAQTGPVTLIEDLVNPPGRYGRPPRIVIILRGPPGSGKTYLAKLIKDKEVENGGSAPRILSLDDYFMVEQEKQIVEDGKLVKIKEMNYEYEAEMEDSYRQSLVKSFKKTITDGYFNFVIVDNVNDKVKYFGEMWSFAKQNGFQVYICQLDLDPQLCTRRNIHNRSEADIEECIAAWEPTPTHHPMVDASSFLQSVNAITEVEMEEVDHEKEEQKEVPEDHSRSKWDSFDCSVNNLARLDGVNKPLRPSRTMEEYLQLDDAWEEPSEPRKPGQKRVRWADLEEQKQQKKMRALGFVVGHTNWDRMMDPSSGENALRQTKYIERVKRY